MYYWTVNLSMYLKRQRKIRKSNQSQRMQWFQNQNQVQVYRVSRRRRFVMHVTVTVASAAGNNRPPKRASMRVQVRHSGNHITSKSPSRRSRSVWHEYRCPHSLQKSHKLGYLSKVLIISQSFPLWSRAPAACY